MPNPIVYFEILGKKPKKLRDFYTKVFEWKMDAMKEMDYAMVLPGGKKGINGGIGEINDELSKPVGLTFYIEVKNPAAALKSVTKAGGKVIMPVTKIPGMITYALFEDPEGNVVGIIDEKIPK